MNPEKNFGRPGNLITVIRLSGRPKFENLILKKSFHVMEHLLDLIGGRDSLAASGMGDYDGINRFNL